MPSSSDHRTPGCELPCTRRNASLGALLLFLAIPLCAGQAGAATLAERAKEVAERAKEANCAGKPKQVDGGSYFKCETAAGVASFFNVPEITSPIDQRASRPAGNGTSTPTPPRAASGGFPRIDAETQKGRDDVRRRVLNDELAAEDKLLTEARTAHADGAPVPLAEERTDADKYRERIARLRQAVALHERNVEALKKEIAGIR